jgi:hypothetical protein
MYFKTTLMSVFCCFLLLLGNHGYAGRCTGSASCHACTTCDYCKHCAQNGGTCGVCGGGVQPERAASGRSAPHASGSKVLLWLVIGGGVLYAIGKRNQKR